MKIGIDVSMLVYRGSGVANYTYNLTLNLLKYDQKNEYRLFYSSLRKPRDFYYLQEFRKLGAKVYDLPFPPRLLKFLWSYHHLMPVEWLIGKVDYFFSSDFLRPPLLKGTKGITTIHDLTWKIFPDYHNSDIVNAHEKKLEKTIKYRDLIITDSKNTKNDLIKYYPEIEKTNKIFVIYPGVSEQFKIIDDQAKIKNILKKYRLSYPKRYLLYIGAIEPRKNLEISVKIFSDLIKDKKYSDFEFIVAGRAGWKNENFFALIKNLKLENKIKFVGYVKDNDLPFFYNACTINIYLSKYEGFGLPPLEALKCGKLTLLYNNSSIGEIFGKNYLYAEKNQELLTLKKLIQLNHFDKYKIKSDFSWKTFTNKFQGLLT